MKKFNHILLAAICATSLAFVACEDEAEYTPAGAATASGVYFSTESPSTVNLSKEATSFDVEVFRGDDSADAAVELIVNIDEENAGKLTIPTVANFAKGSKVTTITIGYDPNSLEYEDWIDVQLIVKDEALRSPYAEYSYAFTAGIPAPYTKVVAANGDETATYCEDFLASVFGLDIVTYDLEIRENDIYPGIYRLMNPYGEAWPLYVEGITDLDNDYYIQIDARDPEGVYIDMSNLGVDIGYGICYAYSKAANYLAGGYSLEEIKAAGYCGTLKDGIITFPMNTLYMYLPEYNSTGLYYANSNGAFRVALPGYEITDYTVDVTYKGRLTAPDEENHFAVATVAIGDDVESARVAMVKTSDVNAAINAILEGTVSTTEITQETEGQDLQFLLDGDGDYVIAAISYAENEAKEAGYATFSYVSTAKNEWESLGTGLYTDDYVGSLYQIGNITYEVEVQANIENPGLYRLVNPYNGNVFPISGYSWDDTKKYYMEINACDPEGVYIPLQSMGCDFGYGEFYVYSLAANYLDNGYSLEDAKAAGVCGTLVDGVITFPVDVLASYEGNDGPYYGNRNGAFCLVLPDAVSTYSTQSIEPNVIANTSLGQHIAKLMPKFGLSMVKINEYNKAEDLYIK